MARITVQQIVPAGIAPTYEAAAASQFFANPMGEERTFLHAKNTNGSSRTVTLEVVRTSANVPGAGVLTIADIVVTLDATTGEKIIGPIPEAYNDANGDVQITWSATAGVTVAAFRGARLSP